jgi:hypothetical protein
VVRLLCAACLLIAAGSLRAAEIAGVKIDDTARVGGTPLVLNGAGKRTRLVFDVYVAALYLTARQGSAPQVLEAPGPKRITLSLMRDLSADRLTEALQDGIKLNTSDAALDAIRPQLEALVAAIRSIGAAHKGDVLSIDFLADDSTQLALNGAPKGQAIAGVAFQRALLGVWLGEKPVQADLKAALLGG